MPESELAGKATNLIKAADKLARDVRKDISKLLEALKELKELKGDIGGKKDETDQGKG